MDIFSTIFGNLETLGKSYAKELFEITSPYTLGLFSSFFALWVLWWFIALALRGVATDRLELYKQLMIFSVVIFALKSSSFYWEYFYTPLLAVTQQLSCLFLKSTGNLKGGGSLKEIIQGVEGEMQKVWEIVWAIWREAAFYQAGQYFTGLVILLCFAFMLCLFVAYTLELVFSLLAVTALSPLLIVAFAFSATRPFTLSALRILLHGAFTVLFASIAMGFTLSSIQAITGAIPLEDGSFTINVAAFTEKGFFPLVVVGFIGILFHLKASSLASALASVHISGTSAALVSGAGLYAWAQMKSAGMKGLNTTRNAVADGAGYVARTSRENIRNNLLGGNINEGIES